MNFVGAIVAGLAGTIAMSMVMLMAPRMGMPKMAIWETLGSMFSARGNTALGWIMHFMMGIVFAIIYAALWAASVGSAALVNGLIFGAIHWLVVGLMMAGVPMMHAGVRAGTIKAPGVYMASSGGMMAFVGGLIGHVIYGLIVALVYGAFIASL
jgi:uncharacterized membrane protein YagU involved in acid resistance